MGRVGLVIDKAELADTIKELEAVSTFTNRSKLYEAVCKTVWAEGIKDGLGRPHKPGPANIYQYVVKYELESVIKTPQGKRGNPNLAASRTMTPEQKASKIKNRPHYITSIGQVRANMINHYRSKEGKDFKGLPPNRENLLKRAAKGNLKSILKLKCLECCCFEASECAQCMVLGCPLYIVNPFLRTTDVEATLNEVDNDESVS